MAHTGGMDEATLVVFGASGDMARRLLFPALYQLEQARRLGNVKIVAHARRDWSPDEFLDVVSDGIRSLAGLTPAASTWKRFARRFTYVRGDLSREGIEQLRPCVAGNVAFYLALPPELFIPAADTLGQLGFSHEDDGWRRLVVEKPFGHDLDSALELNRRLHRHWSEDQIFRIDHFLGKETVQNILVFRFANRFLDPVFNCHHVDYVEITAAETLGLEGRVTFYDGVGALRDMLQSHLMQVMALVAMEPLSSWDTRSLHDHKVDLLRSVRPITPESVDAVAARGQYGRKGKVIAYREEQGIDQRSNTETFAALKLHVDNWRWHGTPFYLRSGKRLQTDLTEVTVHFRQPPFRLPGMQLEARSNELTFRLRPHESISLGVQVRKPGLEMATTEALLHADYAQGSDTSSAAYRQLILDLLEGEQTAFLRFDEVETAWRILEPVLDAWRKGEPEIYPAGSEGPRSQFALLEDGHTWRPLNADPLPTHG